MNSLDRGPKGRDPQNVRGRGAYASIVMFDLESDHNVYPRLNARHHRRWFFSATHHLRLIAEAIT